VAGMAGGVTKSTDAKPVQTAIPKGAVHSAEIEYAMGNLPKNEVYSWTADDYKVSKDMQNYFANFIKTGNPNGQGLPNWAPVSNSNNVQYMQIDVKSELKTEKNRNRYLLLDELNKKK